MPKPNSSCKVCATPFYGSPGHKESGWAIYCSRRCRNKDIVGINHSCYKKENSTVVCKKCGCSFHQKPSSIKHGKSRTFCSNTCRESYSGKVDAKCDFCKKIFKIHQSRKKKIKYGVFTCSNRCRYGNMIKRRVPTPKYKGGYRKDIDLYVRSSWEANYARYLNFLLKQGSIEKWEYESETFEFVGIKKGTRFYTPDFKITENGGAISFHEVKGWMDKKSLTKLKRMKKYYPNIPIVLIQKKEMTEIKKKVGKIIGWVSGANDNL